MDADAGAEPVGDGFVERLRGEIGALVRLDQQRGGTAAAPVVLRAYRRARHRVERGGIRPGRLRDVHSALAELAEVAGWSLADSADHRLAERVNARALGHARLAGDRDLELFVQQNRAMLAEWTGRPRQSVAIATNALERGLSPRLEALFRLRLARANALLGRDTEARKHLARARGLHAEGVRDDDPPWSWWVNEAQLRWFEGAVALDLGRPAESVEAFEQATATASEPRMDHLCRTWALYAHAVNGSWEDVDRLFRELVPHVAEFHSALARSRLAATLDVLAGHRPPSTVRDLAEAVRTRTRA